VEAQLKVGGLAAIEVIARARASSAGKRSGFGRTFAIRESDPRKTSSAVTKAV
jgi:hypothetical protein